MCCGKSNCLIFDENLMQFSFFAHFIELFQGIESYKEALNMHKMFQEEMENQKVSLRPIVYLSWNRKIMRKANQIVLLSLFFHFLIQSFCFVDFPMFSENHLLICCKKPDNQKRIKKQKYWSKHWKQQIRSK